MILLSKLQLAYNVHRDLVKFVTWCTISNFSYWYHMKVWILFSELFTWAFCDTGIKSYVCSKVVKNNKKNIRIMLLMLISLTLQCHSVQHVTGFLRSHHIIHIHDNYISAFQNCSENFRSIYSALIVQFAGSIYLYVSKQIMPLLAPVYQ